MSLHPEYILKMIYDSRVQSKLLYGLLLWGTDLNDTVKIIQKKSIKTITFSPYVSHIIQTSWSFKDLSKISISYVLKYFYKPYNFISQVIYIL